MNLLPDPECCTLEVIREDQQEILIEAHTTSATASCPDCRHECTSVHSYYRRKLADLPCQGKAVRCILKARKFRCQNPECSRKVFAERLPTIAQKHAQKTTRLCQMLREITWLTGGNVAARIARIVGIVTSADATLYQLKRTTFTQLATPKVLGVDDFAFRRGHVYGTILVDLERRCPIDLLPDREAETIKDWLKSHPGVEILSRDRSTAYADAAHKAIPQAVQVADRWHLVRNLAEGVTRFLDQHRADVRAAAAHLASEPDEVPVVWPPTKGIAAEEHRHGQRAKRRRRYDTVKALQEQGMSQRKIAQTLGLSRGQVKRFAHASTFPEIGQYKSQPTSLDPYKSYLQRRWKEGCHNGQQLFREIQEQGFAGSCSWVSRYITGLRRGAAEIIPLPRRVPASRSIASLFLRSPEDLTAKEQRFVDQLCQAGTAIETVYDLTRRFVTMVRLRQEDKLSSWLADVQNCGVHGLNGFAKGLIQDLAAVEAGLSLSWSNGPVEGQVNRLKLVKRSMYGRASFELLKARVLPLSLLPAIQ